jgi:hypothetical protein
VHPTPRGSLAIPETILRLSLGGVHNYPPAEYDAITMNGRTVVLYGRSLLLSGVAASLEQCPALHVMQAGAWTEASRLLAEHTPDVLIFDLTNASDSHILSLLLTNPGLLMIGLDAECNQAVLVVGHEARSLTLSQIREIVEGR